MSDLAEKLAKLKKTAEGQLKECGVSNIDQELLETLVNRLRTMVEKKLGIMDKDKAMGAIHAVAEKMSGIRMKSRPAFYYLVQQELS